MKFKKIISMALATTMVGAMSVSAFAKPSSQQPNNNRFNIISGARVPTPEERRPDDPDKKKPLYGFNSINRATRASSWINASNTKYYYQQKSNTCGAACARMVIYQQTGSAPSEATAKTECNVTANGCTIYDIQDYVNREQSYPFSTKTNKNKSSFEGNIACTLMDDALPVVGMSPTADWPSGNYRGGHFIIISGVRNDDSEYRVMDPAGSSKGTYTVTNSELWDSYTNGGLGYMY